jgi:hypothetical protein
MAAVYDDARAASLLEGDFVVACQHMIALHGLLVEVLYKYEGQGLSWTGSNKAIPENQDVLAAINSMLALRDLMDAHKTNITKGANLIVTQAVAAILTP